jgi:protoheme IX farnesyltransferase
MFGYAYLYTRILKHQTPQNIVIGGLSGALPPLLGWVCITGTPSAAAWLLVLIIFAWTPPHFWALALAKKEEYTKTNIPMLPITHGVPYTLVHIWYYSILTVIATLLPYLTTTFGTIYLIGLLPLNGQWLRLSWQVKQETRPPMQLFGYSITYLMLLFILMLTDHFLRPLLGQFG